MHRRITVTLMSLDAHERFTNPLKDGSDFSHVQIRGYGILCFCCNEQHKIKFEGKKNKRMKEAESIETWKTEIIFFF